MFERSRDLVYPETKPYAPHIVRGADSILRMSTRLMELCAKSGQPGAMDDLNYFLSRPQIRKKTPCVIAMSAGAQEMMGDLDAAVLLYEHQMSGRGLRIFATDDTTGRRTLVSAPLLRSRFALAACHTLLAQGAQCVLLSFRHDETCIDAALAEILADSGYGCRWASREREIAGHLPFESTLDATLAQMGARTRNHLRYYRKKAEQQMGCVFVPVAKISREDLIALNRICAYPVPDDVAAWRYDSLSILKSPLLYGLRDCDGRWLSLIGGRHSNGNMEMYWQMNRDDIPSQSISTAMRAFLIEHEAKQGTRRLYVEGGTTHSMSHAFVREKVTDLIVLRQSPIARIIPALVKRFLPPENMLLQVLEDNALTWNRI
ncbi:MAG: hypothetical protein JSS95_09620 [Acidobacteria bacterium]|nr:hypothetical protein [Acidobacteriota bacterium]